MTDSMTSGIADELRTAAWRTSTYSFNHNGECVEVAPLAEGRLAVRDSKRPRGGTVVIDGVAVAAWLAGLKG